MEIYWLLKQVVDVITTGFKGLTYHDYVNVNICLKMQNLCSDLKLYVEIVVENVLICNFYLNVFLNKCDLDFFKFVVIFLFVWRLACYSDYEL
jgi:hypothetical protein